MFYKKQILFLCMYSLTKDTENLLNEQTFSWMKPEAIIINTSRGPLIDENALYHALKDKKLAMPG